MDYRKMSEQALQDAYLYSMRVGNVNAAREIEDFRRYYGKHVKVVRGKKVPLGTTGDVFWLKRCCYGKYGDPWGIYSDTRIGIKDDSGHVWFTSADNVEKA